MSLPRRLHAGGRYGGGLGAGCRLRGKREVVGGWGGRSGKGGSEVR